MGLINHCGTTVTVKQSRRAFVYGLIVGETGK